MLLFDRETSEYEICIKIDPRDFGQHGLGARFRVVQSLEWWTCVHGSRVQSPNAEYISSFFVLNLYLK